MKGWLTCISSIHFMFKLRIIILGIIWCVYIEMKLGGVTISNVNLKPIWKQYYKGRSLLMVRSAWIISWNFGLFELYWNLFTKYISTMQNYHCSLKSSQNLNFKYFQTAIQYSHCYARHFHTNKKDPDRAAFWNWTYFSLKKKKDSFCRHFVYQINDSFYADMSVLRKPDQILYTETDRINWLTQG